MNEPKSCQLCGFIDSLAACATCPNDGEATWSPLLPTLVPEPEPTPAPAPETTTTALSSFPSKKKGK